MRYLLHVVRLLRLSLTALVLVTIVALDVPAQASIWPGYLQGQARDELARAVRTIETRWAVSASEHDARYQALQDLYVTARSEPLRPDAYAELLRRRGFDEAEVDDELAAARSAVADALAQEIPLPGTRSYATAIVWLSELARREGFPAQRFRALVERADGELFAPLSDRLASELVDSMPVPTENVPGELTTVDAARDLFAMWALLVLGSPETARVRLLAEMVSAIRGIGAAAGEPVADELAALSREREAAATLRGLHPVSPEAIALVSPYVFGDPGAVAVEPQAIEEVRGLVLALSGADLSSGVELYEAHGELAFLVDTVQSLLASSSDLQRYELATLLGVTRRDLDYASSRLYQIRGQAARLPAELEGLAAAAPAADSLFADFLDEGSDYVADARPWAAGERSRSGDAYRWAMLPIVSHPYAQYLTAALPEHADTRAMVDGFVSQVYETAMRGMGDDAPAISSIVLGDAIQPFARVYRVRRGASAATLYQAFAAAAQGVDELSPDFLVPYTAGLTLAGYWSHMHGLHVAVVPDGGDGREAVASLVRARVDDWFSLARASDTEQEELSLTIRGLLALRRALVDELDPLLVSSGVASVDVYQPRLPIALDLLDGVASFTADPFDVRDLLGELYQAPPGDATNDLIADDLGRLLTRLRDVEMADRRVLIRLAGTREGG